MNPSRSVPVVVSLRSRSFDANLELPPGTDVLAMQSPPPLTDVDKSLREALQNPLHCSSLERLCQSKLSPGGVLRACIVISDHTRPLAYTGINGVLWPVVETLIATGVPPQSIIVLVATGTHRAPQDGELRTMIDERVWAAGIAVRCHECDLRDGLVEVGLTEGGTRAFLNRHYVESDLRVVIGLVESHFMAGVSGGRKSICPGLLARDSIYAFHGAAQLDSAEAADLRLDGNPCHREALDVARLARPDFVVNVTIDGERKPTGIFAGDLEEAHAAAYRWLLTYAELSLPSEYDVAITHAGYVGVNHYQAAKAAVVARRAVRPGGAVLLIADAVDPDPIGSGDYRMMLRLLKTVGAPAFRRLLLSDDWAFISDQWQVQMWAKVFAKIAPERFAYFSPQARDEDFENIPGVNGSSLVSSWSAGMTSGERVSRVVRDGSRALVALLEREAGRAVRIAYLADGPLAIPTVR